MKPTLLVPVAVLLTPFLASQDGAQNSAQASAETKSAAKEFAAFQEEFEKATAGWLEKYRAVTRSEKYKELRAAGDRDAINELLQSVTRPNDEFAARALKLANRYAPRAAEAQFLVWAATNAQDAELIGKAVDGLTERHTASAEIVGLVRVLPRMSGKIGAEKTNAAIASIIANAADKNVKAEALYARASIVTRDRNASAEERAAAQADLKKVIALAPDSLAGLRARAPEFAKNLQIGKVAPDIVGEDLFGNDFKLSDYRGKVVVIDFWGDW